MLKYFNLIVFFSRSGIMANTMIKWVTMTYYLCGTIVCVSLYLLKRFTTVDVIEQENMFTRSPNAILKTVPITMVSTIISEMPPNKNIDYEMKQQELYLDKNGNDCNELSKTNSILLLNEIVTEAAKVTDIDNDSQMQKQSEHMVLEES